MRKFKSNLAERQAKIEANLNRIEARIASATPLTEAEFKQIIVKANKNSETTAKFVEINSKCYRYDVYKNGKRVYKASIPVFFTKEELLESLLSE